MKQHNEKKRREKKLPRVGCRSYYFCWIYYCLFKNYKRALNHRVQHLPSWWNVFLFFFFSFLLVSCLLNYTRTRNTRGKTIQKKRDIVQGKVSFTKRTHKFAHPFVYEEQSVDSLVMFQRQTTVYELLCACMLLLKTATGRWLVYNGPASKVMCPKANRQSIIHEFIHTHARSHTYRIYTPGEKRSMVKRTKFATLMIFTNWCHLFCAQRMWKYYTANVCRSCMLYILYHIYYTTCKHFYLFCIFTYLKNEFMIIVWCIWVYLFVCIRSFHTYNMYVIINNFTGQKVLILENGTYTWILYLINQK